MTEPDPVPVDKKEEQMPELLKDSLNPGSLRELALAVQSVYPPFQVEGFLQSVMAEGWEALALKARFRRISLSLGEYLPRDYPAAIAVLERAVTRCGGWGLFGFPDFVEVFGQGEEDWEASVRALERFTPYASAEFAVRPFLIKDQERMMARMYAWSRHENEHVRRLASEGCRPRLPWGRALTRFQQDPSPILPILRQLRDDPSPYVRRSVANNLNDISKDHPDLVTALAKDWHGESVAADWILKHGCRTLLKQGNREVLALFGYGEAPVEVEGFALGAAAVCRGEELTFSFAVAAREAAKIRLEYAVDYVKAKGKRSRKVFQISEISLGKDKRKRYVKKHSFADRSTRRHYPGVHSVTLIVNGGERGRLDFQLL